MSQFKSDTDYLKLLRAKSNLRDTIDGELNRISVSEDRDEIISMLGHLLININDYAAISLHRISLSFESLDSDDLEFPD